MNNLLSIQEAADLLKVHAETLRRWDREGKLIAIKVGDRGDRKYRYEDLIKVRAGYDPKTYKGFDIVPHSSGFENSPGTIIRIASFIVRSKEIVSVFAFAESMLNRMSYPHLTDDKLLKEAKEIMEKYIENNKIENLEEYTFEYHASSYIDVNNPGWWNKTLKEIYK